MDTRKNLSLLIVEDDSDSRSYYVELLGLDFKKIYQADSIQEAKLLYNRYLPDIILLDITLPDGNGLDFLREIRKDDMQTKVIALTAHSDHQTILNATDLKLTKYLVKPLQYDALIEALSMAVSELQNFNIEKNDILKLKGGYTWKKKEKLLYKDSRQIPLSNKQRTFLELLCKTADIPVTKEQIIYTIWEDDDFDAANTNLKTLVKNLRKRLGNDLIASVYGVGYMIKTR